MCSCFPCHSFCFPVKDLYASILNDRACVAFASCKLATRDHRSQMTACTMHCFPVWSTVLCLHQIFPLRNFGEFVVAQDIAQLPLTSLARMQHEEASYKFSPASACSGTRAGCGRSAEHAPITEQEELGRLQNQPSGNVKWRGEGRAAVELPADTLTKSRLISETQSMSMPSLRATDALAAWEKMIG